MVDVARVAARGAPDSAETLRAIDGAALAAWLGRRRWFGEKGRAPRDVRIGALVPLAWSGGRATIARLEVDFGEGGTAHYQLPLAIVAPDHEAARDPIAMVERASGAHALVDASLVPAFRRALADAFARGGAAFDGDGARFVVETLGEGAAEMGRLAADDGRVGSAEQSNTSIVYGDRAILKLFRRLEIGENPDVELTRALTVDAAFPNTPALLGVARLETAEGIAVAAMLQRFAAGSRDAWAWLLDAGRERVASGDGSVGPLANDIRRLGAVTRAMHDALARGSGPDRGPEPATDRDVREWAAGARRTVTAALDLLAGRASALDGQAAATAGDLVARRESYLGLPDALAARVRQDAGQRIRHHGDYHLGQVLHTREGEFLVIDFEGEPARPLAERRARSSALRDVAGMLRSFAYAAATLAAEPAANGGAAAGDDARARAERWTRDARSAFLDGYFGPGEAPFLPRERAHADALITLFETEKVFYELSYELNNRPGWVWIPLLGIARLDAGAPA